MATGNDAAISVSHLAKLYGGRRAVDDLSFTVKPGEVFALLGPNGAGKTTTVEILEGYRVADAGTVEVLGLDPQRDGDRLRPRIGVMLQQGGIYPQIRPREALELFAAFYPRPADPAKLLRQVGLEDAASVPFRRLSGGQKQRLGLALALVGRPELVFLDEPTAGMDPQARRATWDLVRELKASGVTVLLTTHYLEEAERLADRVAIIDQGRLLALGSPADLMEVERARHARFLAPAGLDLADLQRRLPGATIVEERPGEYLIGAEITPALVADLAAWLRERDVLLAELRVGHRSLEELFLDLTGREIRD